MAGCNEIYSLSFHGHKKQGSRGPLCQLKIVLCLPKDWTSSVYNFHCTQPPLTEVTKLLCPHHEGAGAPHPYRVGGPDLWYQMTLVGTTVEQSLVSSAGGARG